MLMNKSRTISSFAKLGGILTLMPPLEVISFFTPIAPIWLRDLHQGRQYSEDERRQKREASIKLDYDHLLVDKSPTLQNLFHNLVYPHFINQTLEDKFEEVLQSQTEFEKSHNFKVN
jgi:hypothetical protein